MCDTDTNIHTLKKKNLVFHRDYTMKSEIIRTNNNLKCIFKE